MYTESERDALLARLDDRSARMERVMFGNGRPGLISDVEVVKQEIEDLKARTPSNTEKATNWIATLSAIIIAVASGLMKKEG